MRKHTIDVTFANSMSLVTATDWTRNLSLHLASAAGSSFIACRRTRAEKLARVHYIETAEEIPTLNIDLFTGLHTAGVGAHTVAIHSQISNTKTKIRKLQPKTVGTYCLGAVVLT